jgi:uncharacterized OB-fold protein
LLIATSTPIPVPDELSAPFWEAAARHVLVIQRCDECSWFAYPPTDFCGNCLAVAGGFTWEPVSGAGQVRTWTIMRQAFLPGFDAELPYVVGDVELAEQAGLRMVARLVDIDLGQLRLGMDVHVGFTVAGDLAVPHFSAPAATKEAK